MEIQNDEEELNMEELEKMIDSDLDKLEEELQTRSLYQISEDVFCNMYKQFISNVKSIQNNKKVVAEFGDYLNLLGTSIYKFQDLTANQIAKIYNRTFDLIMPLPDVAEKYNFLTNEFIDLMAGNDTVAVKNKLVSIDITYQKKVLMRINERNCLETLIRVNNMKHLANCWNEVETNDIEEDKKMNCSPKQSILK